MITINYIPHQRMYFSNLFFYFLNKIKEENKKHIILNIYTSSPDFFNENCKKLLNITYNIINCSPFYNTKLQYIKSNNTTEYSIKCDEDIFMNNFVLDFLIENTHIVDQKNVLLLSPLMSCNIPTTDYFINSYFDEEDKQKIQKSFLNVKFGELWDYDYSFLNEFTINATDWNFEKFLEATNKINFHYKGIHPIRAGREPAEILNSLLLENLDKFLNSKNFNIFYLNKYFTNSFFLIRTDRWLELLNDKTLYVDPYDEVPLNKYAVNNNMSYGFIDGAFAIHTTFNTNTNMSLELEFQRNLENRIIK